MVDLSSIGPFIIFSIASLVTSLLIGGISVFVTIPFLTHKTPKQILFKGAHLLTGENPHGFSSEGFFLFYFTIIPSYSVLIAISGLPYIWFVNYANNYPNSYALVYIVFAIGVVYNSAKWFSERTQLNWIESPKFSDYLILLLYISILTTLIIVSSYTVGYNIAGLL